jgi:2,2-dialkylglycine decarboxylase (pyruvate)
MHLWQTNPFQAVTIVRGEGCTVWDSDGKAYLDLLAGCMCNILGYGHPHWKHAIEDQLSRITHVGWSVSTTEINEALAKLAEILPPALNRAVFLSTGSEAVELALKMARAATGADGIAVIEKGYYGATSYAMALSEAGRTAPYLPALANVLRLPAPICRRCPCQRTWPCGDSFACLDPLREAADRPGQTLATVIYEPVMSVGGVIVLPPTYGAQLRDLADRCGALLIAEEVTSGMGRTGRWFAFEHDGIVPDILVIGKALGGGLPVAAVVTTEAVETRCQGTLHHVQSHQNDPFSGRIAAAVITIMQEERLVERAAECGAYLLQGLDRVQASNPLIAEVRGKGAMVGIELKPEWADKGPAIERQMLDAGFIVHFQPHTATIRLYPPFTISTREMDAFLETFEQVLGQYAPGG